MSISLEQARTFLTNETIKYQNENIERVKNIANLDAKNEKQSSLQVKHENFRLGFTKRALIIFIATEQLLNKKFETQLTASKSNLEREIKELRDYVDKYQKEMEIPGNSAFIKRVTAELEAIEQITNNCYEAALKNNINRTRNIIAAPQNLRRVLYNTTPTNKNDVIPELPKTNRNDTERLIQLAPAGKFSDTESIRNIATQMIALHESIRSKTRPNQDDLNKEEQLYNKFEKLARIMQKPGAFDHHTADSIRKVHDIFKVYRSLSEIPVEDQVDYLIAYLNVYADIRIREKQERLDISDLVLLNELQSKIITLYVQIPLQLLTTDLQNQYRNFRESIKEIKQINPPQPEENIPSERPPSWSEYIASVGNNALESARRMASSLGNLPTYDETEQTAFNIERDKLLQDIEAFEKALIKAQGKILPQEYDYQIKIVECRKKLLNSKDVNEFNNNWLALNKVVTEFSELMNKIYYSQALNTLPARVTNMLNDIKYRTALDYVSTARYLGIEIDTPEIINNPIEEQAIIDQTKENLIYTGLKEKYLILDKIKQKQLAILNEISDLQKILQKSDDKLNIENQLVHLKNKLKVYNIQENLLNIKAVNTKALDIFYEQLVDYTQKLRNSEKENMGEFEVTNKEIHAIALRCIGVDPATHRRSTELDAKFTQVTHKRQKTAAPQLDPKILGQELFAVYKELASKLELFNLDIAATDTNYRQIHNLFNKLKKLQSNIYQSQEKQNEVSQEIDKIFSELQNDEKTVKIILQQLGQPNINNMVNNADIAINKLPEIIEARKKAKDRLVSKGAQKLLIKIEELMYKRDNYIEWLKKSQAHQKKLRTTEIQDELPHFKQELNQLRKKFDEIKSVIGNPDPSDHKAAVSIQSSAKELEEARIKLEEAEKIVADFQNHTRNEYQKLTSTRWVKSNTQNSQNQRFQNKT